MEVNLKTIDNKGITIDSEVSLDAKELNKIGVESLKSGHVSGRMYLNVTEEIIFDVVFDGILILRDAVDNSLIEYPISIDIREVFEENDTNNQNILDINSILWQNIVLEVPIRVVSDENRDNSRNGDGWELKSEDTLSVDPGSHPLMDLLKEGKE